MQLVRVCALIMPTKAVPGEPPEAQALLSEDGTAILSEDGTEITNEVDP